MSLSEVPWMRNEDVKAYLKMQFYSNPISLETYEKELNLPYIPNIGTSIFFDGVCLGSVEHINIDISLEVPVINIILTGIKYVSYKFIDSLVENNGWRKA